MFITHYSYVTVWDTFFIVFLVLLHPLSLPPPPFLRLPLMYCQCVCTYLTLSLYRSDLLSFFFSLYFPNTFALSVYVSVYLSVSFCLSLSFSPSFSLPPPPLYLSTAPSLFTFSFLSDSFVFRVISSPRPLNLSLSLSTSLSLSLFRPLSFALSLSFTHSLSS